jgi:ribosomal protein S18 acetylase RimI-like enzyme
MNSSTDPQKSEDRRVKIFQAFVEDAEEILSLQKLAFRSEAELYNDNNIAPLKQTLNEIQAEFKTHVFLKAVCEGNTVGTVRAHEKDGICYIGRLAVLPNMQNHGIGATLMKEIEGHFKSKRFELFVGSKSEKNKHLYEKLGYSIFKKESYGCGSAIEVFYMEKFYEGLESFARRSMMMAYCGLDCSKCIGFLATQSGDAKEIAEVAQKWSIQFNADVKPEHVLCDGCKAAGRKSYYCGNLCKIAKCCSGKKMSTCAECGDYACEDLSFVLEHSLEAKENLGQLRKNK